MSIGAPRIDAAAGTWLLAVCCLLAAGCSPRIDPDPYLTLGDPMRPASQHVLAIEAVGSDSDRERAATALEKVVSGPDFSVPVREEALNRLVAIDLPRAKTAIRRTLPLTKAWGWITRLSQIIAERGWSDLSPALVSSWARPSIYVTDDLQRPEYVALSKLHGAPNVTEVVYALFSESRSVAQQGLRTRCWELLHRLGQRERLVELVAQAQPSADDAMLLDLHAGAADLGIVPRTREEILWLRALRQPEHAEFWSQAAAAVQGLPAGRRAQLELRDLPIVVSAAVHEPALLATNGEELYQQVEAKLRGRRHHSPDGSVEGFGNSSMQRLHESRDQLTWGDLAAMLIALRALEVPQVVQHLFAYAEDDRDDTSTEYGGVLSLDGKDRFEIREFKPVVRHHDNKFIASQAMLDAAYTSIFHFHMHVQRYVNTRFAGPGHGDHNYADSTRANCLVFTFINQHTMNVDFYRHGGVVVDLGEISRR